jgi:hypothetical protein
MSHLGQSRRFGRVPVTSGLHLRTDILKGHPQADLCHSACNISTPIKTAYAENGFVLPRGSLSCKKLAGRASVTASDLVWPAAGGLAPTGRLLIVSV